MDTISLSVVLKWIHLMATVAWIGGMFHQFLYLHPGHWENAGRTPCWKTHGCCHEALPGDGLYFHGLFFITTGIMMGSLNLNSGEVFLIQEQNDRNPDLQGSSLCHYGHTGHICL